MKARGPEPDYFLTPAEVASLFHVDPKTISRLAWAGKLPSIQALGGHRRYWAREVHALLDPGVTARSRQSD